MRNSMIWIRMSDKEKAEAFKQAKDAGFDTLSAYIRWLMKRKEG